MADISGGGAQIFTETVKDSMRRQKKRGSERSSEGIAIKVRAIRYEIAAVYVSAVLVSSALLLRRTDVELNSS